MGANPKEDIFPVCTYSEGGEMKFHSLKGFCLSNLIVNNSMKGFYVSSLIVTYMPTFKWKVKCFEDLCLLNERGSKCLKYTIIAGTRIIFRWLKFSIQDWSFAPLNPFGKMSEKCKGKESSIKNWTT